MSEVTVISEKSRIHLTLPQAITIVGVLVTLVGSSAVAWYALNAREGNHEADNYRHLDPKFREEHGAPVGKWDLAPMAEATTRALAALQAQADRTEQRLSAQIQADQDRKPRYRP